MHDPLVVAFVIRRPWPQRKTWGKGRLYWPALITVWHMEPGGADSLTVCKHHTRWQWHVHHWRLQVHPLQHLRRWALTRCAWCGGKSRKGSRVNCSPGWGADRGKWWRGERGLYHSECLSAHRAWGMCTCRRPSLGESIPGHPREHGKCTSCQRFRAWRLDPEHAQWAERVRDAVPLGARPNKGDIPRVVKP